jgi:hypothetical protein
VGTQTLPHDGRSPRRSRETKPTTFETLTMGTSASAAREQTHGQDDQRRGVQESAEPRHHRPDRGSIGLPEPEVDEETTRLGHDPREQKAASELLDSV